MTKIKRINSIQNLGVYNDYRRSGNILMTRILYTGGIIVVRLHCQDY